MVWNTNGPRWAVGPVQQPDGQSAPQTHGTDQGVGDEAESRAQRLVKDVE